MSYIADAYLKAIAKIATPLEEKVARLEAELAEANARLNSAYVKIGDLFKECEDHAKFAHKLKLELAASNAKIEAARALHTSSTMGEQDA